MITLVSLVHAENFPHLEAIVEAKGEIFSHPKTTLGIIPYSVADKGRLLKMGDCQKQTFSIDSARADFFLRGEGDHLRVKAHQETSALPLLQVPGIQLA